MAQKAGLARFARMVSGRLSQTGKSATQRRSSCRTSSCNSCDCKQRIDDLCNAEWFYVILSAGTLLLEFAADRLRKRPKGNGDTREVTPIS